MKIISNVPSVELYFKHIILEIFPRDFIDNINTVFSLNLQERSEYVTAYVECCGIKETDSQSFISHNSKNITRTCAIGRATIKLGCSLGYKIPPYGVLTGVRPIKVASDVGYELNKDVFADLLKDKYLVSDTKSKLLFDALSFDKLVRNAHKHNDVSLYFSIPFCPSRCNYCSFVSYGIDRKQNLIPSYLNVLFDEMKRISSIINHHSLNIKSVYVGGGTPGILNEKDLEKFLCKFNEYFGHHNLTEFTFEIGRPETVTSQKLELLKKYGVDRISINTQTTNDAILKGIGRNHSSIDYFNAIKAAKSFNFKSINTDVIAGLDGETLDSFKRTLNEVVDTNVDNVTVHTLCIKKSSHLKDSPITHKQTEEIDEYVNFSREFCIKNNFEPYYLYRQKYALGNHESVGYCKNGLYSHYNISMMNEIETVIGLGAGATSRVISENGNKHQHFENYKYPNEYINDTTKSIKENQLISSAIANLENIGETN